MSRGYVPERGDAIWLTFAGRTGHEQDGRRPAIVLSPRAYNLKAGLALACPITSQHKGYPFEVVIPPGLPVQGVVLSDQVRSIDWRARHATRICRLPETVFAEASGKLAALVR